jgi:steroid delta-isomerase-like uncharacterized protein
MSLAENKALFRRLYEEVINNRNLAVMDELAAPDLIDHEELPPGVPPGREGAKQFFAMLHQAFPDLRVEADEPLAEGDRVVIHATWRGTHQGTFLGIPPTGKAITFTGIDIVRIQDGKMVEHWGITDSLGLLQQLGAIPAPEQ